MRRPTATFVLLLVLVASAQAFTTKKHHDKTRPAFAGSNPPAPAPPQSTTTQTQATAFAFAPSGHSTAPQYSPTNYEEMEEEVVIGYATAIISCAISLALGFGLGYGTWWPCHACRFVPLFLVIPVRTIFIFVLDPMEISKKNKTKTNDNTTSVGDTRDNS